MESRGFFELYSLSSYSTWFY